MAFFKAQLDGDTFYVKADNHEEAAKKLKENLGDDTLPGTTITWGQVDEVPEGGALIQ